MYNNNSSKLRPIKKKIKDLIIMRQNAILNILLQKIYNFMLNQNQNILIK